MIVRCNTISGAVPWRGSFLITLAIVCPLAAVYSFASLPGGEDLAAPTPNGLTLPLKGIGIDQKLGAQVPADLAFRDEDGKAVRFGDYFNDRPLILSLAYLKCPGLCTLTLNSLEQGLKAMKTRSVGRDFDVLTVSFDPNEKPDLAAAKKREYLRLYNRPGSKAGWHFLTGDADSIRRLTDAVGFRYGWDDQQQQFIHPSGIMILTPKGELSHYLIGIDYPPRVLEQSIAAAAAHGIGQADEQPVLYCFLRDPRTGKWGLHIARALRVGGLLTVAALGLLVVLLIRRHPAAGPASSGPPGQAKA